MQTTLSRAVVPWAFLLLSACGGGASSADAGGGLPPPAPAPTATLSVTIEGAGSLQTIDGAFRCEAACSHTLPVGTSLRLNLSPSTGYILDHSTGTGLDCGGLDSCALTLNADQHITIAFRQVLPVTDERSIKIPDTGSYPAKGVLMADPVTALNVLRLADPSELVGDTDGHRSAMSLIVYSRYTPSNTTGEFVLVHGDNSTSAWVYRVADNAPVTLLRFNPALGQSSRALGELNELRWDYSGQHPYRLYFVGNSISGVAQSGENIGMSFYYTDLDPATGKQSTPVLVHDFSKDFPAFSKASIMNDVEGDSSTDSRFWAWQVMDTTRGAGALPFALFTFDMRSNTVTAALQRSCTGALVPCVALATPSVPTPYLARPNMVEMSPKGTRIVVDWDRVYSGNRDADKNTLSDGPKAFLPNFSDPIRIGADATHSGWAWGANGQELFVSQNNRNDWIEAVDIASASTAKCSLISDNSYACGTKVLPYSLLDGGTWSVGMHFGKFYDPAKRGIIYLNTYDKTYLSWGKNQSLIVAVNDYTQSPSKVFRLGSTYNLYYDYRSEGSGALDFAANNLYTTANWGFTDGRGDAFRVQLPANWYATFQP